MCFAQIPAMGDDPVANWVTMLGALGFSVWYGYYVTAITIPKINADNNATVARIVTDFREEMKLERESHTADMKAQREDCQREMEHIVSSLNIQQGRLLPSPKA